MISARIKVIYQNDEFSSKDCLHFYTTILEETQVFSSSWRATFLPLQNMPLISHSFKFK
jgi:hypothetical protein